MPKLAHEKTIAIAVLVVILLSGVIVPAVFVQTRSDALQELEDRKDVLARFEAARQRAGNKPSAADESVAPPEAFLNSQTPGLASAQLESYLSQLALAQQASLISSGVAQGNRGDTSETVRIQATLDITYDALQPLLYKLEMGTPYVFVDSMVLQPPNAGLQQTGRSMKVTLNLRALWHPMSP